MAGAGIDREIVRGTGHSSNTLGAMDGTSIPPTGFSSSSPTHRQPPLNKVFAMTKGGGEESYSENSQVQKILSHLAIEDLNAALQKVTLPCDGQPVAIADLGCSSGRNSIITIAHIVNQLRPRLTKNIDFQAFFDDIPSNDFNNLFQMLTSGENSNDFFAAGVPGTFYGRLFPRSSIHVFHSSQCLQWLSKVPDALNDKNSPAYNRGNAWIVPERSAVAAAYKEQAALDLTNFLLAREIELVEGGLLCLFFYGRNESEPGAFDDFKATTFGDNFGGNLPGILTDMVAEGVLAEELLDAFNFPLYQRSLNEVNAAVESRRSAFQVLSVKIKTCEINLLESFPATSHPERAFKMTHTWKAVFNGFMAGHLPEHVCHVVWQRFQKLAEAKLRQQKIHLHIPVCVVTLIRK